MVKPPIQAFFFSIAQRHAAVNRRKNTINYRKKEKNIVAFWKKACYNMQVCCVDTLKEDVS